MRGLTQHTAYSCTYILTKSMYIKIKLVLLRFVNITIATYGALSEILDHGVGFSFKEMGLLVDAGYCSTLLYIFCDCSHQATLEVKLLLHL